MDHLDYAKLRNDGSRFVTSCFSGFYWVMTDEVRALRLRREVKAVESSESAATYQTTRCETTIREVL